jgi:chloramphenicol-sensitive protein RarD
MNREVNRGIVYALVAYTLWGFFPVYLKALAAVPAPEILAHRMLWSLVFVGALLAIRRRWDWVRTVVREPRVLRWFVASATVVTVNWGVYIWAVNADRVVDSSLGYFINPLVNVLIGAAFLHERLRPAQWVAVACAASGVLWLTVQAGEPPWVGLVLGVSFGIYGLLRRTAALGALEGLALETLLLVPLALGYLVWLTLHDRNVFLAASPTLQLLLLAAGPATALPLLFFAAGARRIPFSTLGLLQYVGPTLQLILGVWLYHEPFPPAKIAGYAAIWVALLIYSAEGLWRSWARPRAPAAASSSAAPAAGSPPASQ